jgi:hypothetical protein
MDHFPFLIIFSFLIFSIFHFPFSISHFSFCHLVLDCLLVSVRVISWIV